MPRSPVNLTFAGNCHVENGTGSVQYDSLCKAGLYREEAAGTSRRKPKGFIPPTAYSFFRVSVSHAKGECVVRHLTIPAFTSIYRGTVGGGVGLSGRFDSEGHFNDTFPDNHQEPGLANRALISARRKLKGTDVNLGVAFGERSQTARLVGDTATRLAKSYRSLRRGEIRNAMNHLGITSSRREPRGANAPKKWLELQYGWKPLLSDVFGACDALTKRPKSDWIVTAKASSKASGLVVKVFDQFDAGTVTCSWNHSVLVRIDVLPENELAIALSSSGITNPLLVGWELVPFSFVVDWFLPIGGWLEGLDALLGYQVYGYSSSYISRDSWDEAGSWLAPDSGSQVQNSYYGSKRAVRLERSVSNGVPLPSFPGFKDPRSFEHMANGLSLLATVFGRR